MNFNYRGIFEKRIQSFFRKQRFKLRLSWWRRFQQQTLGAVRGAEASPRAVSSHSQQSPYRAFSLRHLRVSLDHPRLSSLWELLRQQPAGICFRFLQKILALLLLFFSCVCVAPAGSIIIFLNTDGLAALVDMCTRHYCQFQTLLAVLVFSAAVAEMHETHGQGKNLVFARTFVKVVPFTSLTVQTTQSHLRAQG